MVWECLSVLLLLVLLCCTLMCGVLFFFLLFSIIHTVCSYDSQMVLINFSFWTCVYIDVIKIKLACMTVLTYPSSVAPHWSGGCWRKLQRIETATKPIAQDTNPTGRWSFWLVLRSQDQHGGRKIHHLQANQIEMEYQTKNSTSSFLKSTMEFDSATYVVRLFHNWSHWAAQNLVLMSVLQSSINSL